MSEAVDISQRCTFPSSIDVTSVLDRLEIQFLDVNERRAIVIFAGAILNLESQKGNLTELECAEITVYDLPTNSEQDAGTETEVALELIEDFRNQLFATSNPAS
ncbi:hypothetical protein RBH26_21165 [Natronolimnohabitans sp. A-GB9]|uniref:hypothetical protein n=1 Tax=Natronolimnohabitans sp. A-GB9 TaxID=3069757 RepID=UPI0027B59DE5|nr:hypothetical protein [Natronolimnohabitans sp. A-GB9]MDQ2052956.1 hypothetical protein [Natronolimnohabitans sp. A-GB9]